MLTKGLRNVIIGVLWTDCPFRTVAERIIKQHVVKAFFIIKLFISFFNRPAEFAYFIAQLIISAMSVN